MKYSTSINFLLIKWQSSCFFHHAKYTDISRVLAASINMVIDLASTSIRSHVQQPRRQPSYLPEREPEISTSHSLLTLTAIHYIGMFFVKQWHQVCNPTHKMFLLHLIFTVLPKLNCLLQENKNLKRIFCYKVLVGYTLHTTRQSFIQYQCLHITN